MEPVQGDAARHDKVPPDRRLDLRQADCQEIQSELHFSLPFLLSFLLGIETVGHLFSRYVAGY
jgi:hypothetical protein